MLGEDGEGGSNKVNKGGAALQIDNQTDTSHNQIDDGKWSPATSASSTQQMRKGQKPVRV